MWPPETPGSPGVAGSSLREGPKRPWSRVPGIGLQGIQESQDTLVDLNSVSEQVLEKGSRVPGSSRVLG